MDIEKLRQFVRRFPTLRWTLLSAYGVYKYLKAVWTYTIASTSWISRGRSIRKKVLFIYDFTSQGYTYGDLLNCHAGSQILCEMHNVDKVDFAFVVNRSKPVHSFSPFSSYVNADSVPFVINKLADVNLVNGKLGSTYFFDNEVDIGAFVSGFQEKYYVWPDRWALASRKFLGKLVYEELFFDFYKSHRQLPNFDVSKYLSAWAEDFFKTHIGSSMAVTVNLRNNPAYHEHRNSDIDVWVKFFQHCEASYQAIFIVICSLDEFDPRLRECKNVIYSKDFESEMSHELALISRSSLHLGASSGPATMALFGRQPYLIVNTDLRATGLCGKPGMIVDLDENFQRLWFSQECQRFYKSKETLDMLVREFDVMWSCKRRIKEH